jgi:hypothetical protein
LVHSATRNADENRRAKNRARWTEAMSGASSRTDYVDSTPCGFVARSAID